MIFRGSLPFDVSEVASRIVTFLFLKQRTRELIDELEGERRLLTTALKKVSDAVVITKGYGEIVFVNDALLSLTGMKSEELIGHPFKELLMEGNSSEYTGLNHKVHEFILNGRVQ